MRKALESNKSIYGNYLSKAGVPKEIASNFETLLQTYCNFMNGYAKHHDKTELNVLEYLMYYHQKFTLLFLIGVKGH